MIVDYPKCQICGEPLDRDDLDGTCAECWREICEECGIKTSHRRGWRRAVSNLGYYYFHIIT